MALQVGTIIALNLIMYWRTIYYGLVSDDIEPSRRKVNEVEWKDKEGKQHKLKNVFHKLWVQYIGAVYFSTKVPHLMTLLTHIANCVLIYFVFQRTDVAFLTALLFSINPVNTQGGSVWLSGKIYSFTTTLCLMMFILPGFSPLFYYLTKFFSINAMFSPLAFIQTSHWYLALMPVAGLLLHRRILGVKAKVGTNDEMRNFRWLKLIPFFKSYGYYFWLCLFPWRLALYHSYLWGVGVNKKYNEQAYSIKKPGLWVGLVTFIATAYLIITHWATPFGYGLFWFFINISMWCNIITYQQQISERTVYTANIGLMFALANLIVVSPVLIAVFMSMYITRLYTILPMYENEYWHTEHSMIEARDCNYIWVARGVKKFKVNNFLGAYLDFMQARICTNWEFKANFNAANMAIILQRFDEADNLLKDAEKYRYEGQEASMKSRIEDTRKWLNEVRETKNIDLKKCQIVR